MVKDAKKAEAKTETVEKEAAAAEKTTGFNFAAAVDDYSANTKLQENGIRHVDKAFMQRRLTEVHGVDLSAVEKYHTAMMDERSAIAEATERDLGTTIETLKADEGSEEAIKASTASTSFWRVDGTETLTVVACDESGDTTVDEGGNVVPVTKHGRIRTSIAGSDHIHRKTVADVSSRVAAWF